MDHKSYWIWHYGDYEIFHTMNVHLRREERGYHRPAFWKISTPYASVKFKKQIECESGYLICHINGNGHIAIDNVCYPEKTRIELTPGAHKIEVHVSNHGGLPAVFIESDVCPSDESWTCNHFAGDFTPVGYHAHFCRADQNPEEFPFAYKTVLPVAKEDTDGGVLYDFGTELFGYLNLSGADEKDELDIFYGESREEAFTRHGKLICVRGIERGERISLFHGIARLFVQSDAGTHVKDVILRLPARAEQERGLAHALCVHGKNITVLFRLHGKRQGGAG